MVHIIQKEIGVVSAVTHLSSNGFKVVVKPGDIIIRIDPRYFRPTEVETLLGDAKKAKEELGWSPSISFEDMVTEMVQSDLQEAKRDLLCSRGGFQTRTHYE